MNDAKVKDLATKVYFETSSLGEKSYIMAFFDKRKKHPEQIPLKSVVLRCLEYAHSVFKKKGNLYLSAREVVNGKPSWKIYHASLSKHRYSAPKPLDTSINNGACVDGPYASPNEEFSIFESDRAGARAALIFTSASKGTKAAGVLLKHGCENKHRVRRTFWKCFTGREMLFHKQQSRRSAPSHLLNTGGCDAVIQET